MLQSILLLLVGRCAFAIHDDQLYSEVIREAVNSEDEDRTAYSGSTKSSGKGKGSSTSSKGGGDYDYGVIFEKSVIVDFDGVDVDPDQLSFVSPGALEMEFVETYNHLSEYLCDVDGVEILEAAIHVDESGEYVIKRGGSYFSLQFDIIATCNNCTDDGSVANLFSYADDLDDDYLSNVDDDELLSSFVFDFDWRNENCTDFTYKFPEPIDDDDFGLDEIDDFARARALKASKKASKKDTMPKGTDSGIKLSSKKSKGSKKSSKKGKGGKGKGKGKGGGGDRICTSSCPAYRAPTHDEFRYALDSTIKEYSGKFSSNDYKRRLGCDFMSGKKLTIDAVIGVREMIPIELACTDEAEELIELVTVEVLGDYSQVTDEEKVELENGFVQRYNAYNELVNCDYPYFRELNSAEIKMVATGGAEPGSFTYVFKLNGTCHGAGCSDDVGLFDTYSSRRLEQEELLNMTDPDLNITDFGDCPFECSSSADLSKGVSTSEFELYLYVLTLELFECGALTHIEGSGPIKLLPLEPVPTAPPTITATPTLSAQPSESAMPSDTPTKSAAPSSSPSSAPSTTPSSSPSSKPSATPSSKPSGSRSPSLSSSPTLSDVPSRAPTKSEAPSSEPSSMPSDSPTTSSAPSSVPSSKPSVKPSSSPSSTPSAAPSSSPSISTVPSLSAEPSATP